jgi:hypothetical protein
VVGHGKHPTRTQRRTSGHQASDVIEPLVAFAGESFGAIVNIEPDRGVGRLTAFHDSRDIRFVEGDSWVGEA